MSRPGSEAAVNAPNTSATGSQVATPLGQYAWASFEFARSPYLGLIYIYVSGPYFANVVVGDPVHGQELWSVANTIVGFVVALLAPVLGAISDRAGPRKPWLVVIVLIMAAGCISLWFAMPKGEGGLPVPVILGVVVVLAGSFLLSEVFHNAMLPSIVPAGRVGFLSGLGLSANNFGAMISLGLVLYGIALPATGLLDWSGLPDKPWLGLDPAREEHNRIVGPIAGIWLLVFTLPMLLWTPDRKPTGASASGAVRAGFAQLATTIRKARQIKNVALYLLARMLYNDGKVAALAYAGLYGAGVFGWEMAELLMAAILMTPFSILGGFAGGWLDRVIGSKLAILLSVGGSIVVLILSLSMSQTSIFFVIPYDAALSGVLWDFPAFQTLPEVLYIAIMMSFGVTIGAAFATSRSMMAKIAPVSMIDQFFGLYALSGTATAFLGHMLVGVFTSVFDSQRAGIGSLVILLVAGLILMFWVKEERAPELV